jgi:cytochrome c
LSVIFTGAFYYFIYFKWPDTVLPENHPGAPRLRLISLSMVLAGLVPLPLLLIWDLAMLPSFSLNFTIFLICIILLILTLILALSSLSLIRSRTVRHATLLIAGATLLFTLVLIKNQMLAAQSNLEQQTLLSAHVHKIQDDWAAERESKRSSSMAVDSKLGERIFNERCTACHQFSQKVVGPAYNDVLPKYVNDPAALESFIRNPVKVDPNYPAMPNQGLNLREVKAVSAYLLEEYGKEKE